MSGVFRGTLSRTPRRTSRSKPSLTLVCQARGTCAGALIAVGLAAGSTYSRRGSLPLMRGRLCLSQTLNAEDENLSRMNCFKVGRFSSVGLQGMVGLSVGGNVLLGHLQG